MELELLQTKLKSQILEHQVLVKQIKSDPQNPDLQKRLKALQNNITSLSEEQNRVVNQLRQELIKPGQPREYDNKNCNTGKLNKVTIKQEPMDHYNDVKPVIMKSVSVSTQNLPNLKPRPSPVVIVSSQSSPTYIYKSPSSPFNVKSPNNISVHQHNNNVLSKDRVSSSAGRSSGNYSSINLPTLLPKPPILIPNELPKKENVMPMDPKKLEFMSALGLITPQAMIEIQAKRQERKRRSNCISPYSSLLMEPEPKKMGRVMMLPVKRGRGRPPKYHSSSAPCSPKTTSPIPNGLQDPSPNKKMRYSRFISEDSPPDEDDDHESACAVCKTSGELLMCDTCNLVYHMNCLDPPLTAIPSGMWICPKCKLSASDCETMPWPGMLSVVRSYMAHKTAKEDEKNYLIKRSQELQAEKMELEAKAKRLSQSIMEQMQTKSELSSSNRKAKNSVDKLIQFIELVQSL